MSVPEPDMDTGRLIITYLQNSKNGATASDIVQHLQVESGKSAEEISNTVTSLLDNGTALGFLERKGSKFMNWVAREMCGRRRRRRSGCRRRRRRVRRRCSRRRRRRRKCRCGWTIVMSNLNIPFLFFLYIFLAHFKFYFARSNKSYCFFF